MNNNNRHNENSLDELQFQIGEPDTDAYQNVPLTYYSREMPGSPAAFRSTPFTPEPSKKGGFLGGMFRSLTDTRPKLLLLCTIIALCLIIAALRLL